MECQSLIIYSCTFLLIVYLFFKWKFSYWKNQGIPTLPPKIPFGNVHIKDPRHLKDILEEIYQKFKKDSPIFGLYVTFSPIAVATDLDLIKNILIKNFHQFRDRKTYFNEKDDPLSAHMFSLDGEKWRRLRHKLSPTFTSGKMKNMFPTVVDVADYLTKSLDDAIKLDPEIEIKEYLGRFTTDVIGRCAFGIECNSLKDPQAEFREKGRRIFSEPLNGRFSNAVIRQFPQLAKKLHIKIFQDDITKFFMNVVRETVAYRNQKQIQRNDFMDLLIELMNGPDGLSIEEVGAQAFIFFIAGFETSSTTLSNAFFELAHQPECQEKARKEILTVLEKHNWDLTYEAMMEMTYLDQIINETLRLYPPVPMLNRVAEENYTIPDTNIILEQGIRVFIPVYSIQRDAEFYPDPEKFNPDRFHPEEMKKRHPMTFLPFGAGPRNCIGLRFGMMQIRIGLINMLRNFKLKPSLKTKSPLKFNRDNLLLVTNEGIYLKFEVIK